MYCRLYGTSCCCNDVQVDCILDFFGLIILRSSQVGSDFAQGPFGLGISFYKDLSMSGLGSFSKVLDLIEYFGPLWTYSTMVRKQGGFQTFQ